MNTEIRTAKRWYLWLWLSPMLTIPTYIYLLYTTAPSDFICTKILLNCGFAAAVIMDELFVLLAASIWHLILLIPIFRQRSRFVRWHGLQALSLVGIRVGISGATQSIGFLLFPFGARPVLDALPILIAVWFFGTLWGQREAARGDCTLMRWLGRHREWSTWGVGRADGTPAGEVATIPKSLGQQETYQQARELMAQGDSKIAFHQLRSLLDEDPAPELKAEIVGDLQDLVESDPILKPEILVTIFRYDDDPEGRRSALAELKRLGFTERF